MISLTCFLLCCVEVISFDCSKTQTTWIVSSTLVIRITDRRIREASCTARHGFTQICPGAE